jgi:hypothetical protein
MNFLSRTPRSPPGGDHPRARQAVALQILVHLSANAGKRLCEVEHPVKFGVIANLSVLGMIAVLAAAAGIDSSGFPAVHSRRRTPDVPPPGYIRAATVLHAQFP